MPIERQRWTPTTDWAPANAQLRRTVETLDSSARVDIRRMDASGTVGLTYPHTLVVVDTTSASVTVTLPDPATVPGFRVEVKKTGAPNTCEVASSAFIDGAASIAWTVQSQSYSLISDGETYHVV
jgi:hypothetical protein